MSIRLLCGSLIAMALPILAVGMTSALASASVEEYTPEQIKVKCDRAAVIDGKRQEPREVYGGFFADWCNFEQTSFETYGGETKRVSEVFRNCPPDLYKNGTVAVKWETGLAQYDGTYQFTQHGGGGGIFGALSTQWLRHSGTLDLNIRTVTASDTTTFPIPEGKTLYVEFTPVMQVMKGRWHVHINNINGGTPWGAPQSWDGYADEDARGPNMLPGSVVNGKVTPVFGSC